MDAPDTRFAWNGDVSLAYQVIGDGPTDLLYLPGAVSNVDVMWESVRYEIDPTLTAISTLLVIVPIVILSGVAVVRRSVAVAAATASRPTDGE